ncbi:hypothetical protein C0991_005176 [Blastosporella zonata]|nr:hypothetical protein C0991_005176 [Blastosporella zonata]
MLNRILMLPDLAGLSTTATHPKLRVLEATAASTDTRPGKRHKTYTSSPLPSDDYDHDFNFHAPADTTPQGSYVSSQGSRITDNRGRGVTYSHKTEGKAGPYTPFQGLGNTLSSLPPSSEQPASSFAGTAGTGSQELGQYDTIDVDVDLDTDFDQPRTPSPPDHSDRSPRMFDEDDIPVLPGREQFRFVKDNLYEHEDPWHTIGVILGLEDVREGECVQEPAWMALREEEDEEDLREEDGPGGASLPFWTTLDEGYQNKTEEDEDEAQDEDEDEDEDEAYVQNQILDGPSQLISLPFLTTQDEDHDNLDLSEEEDDADNRNLKQGTRDGDILDFDNDNEEDENDTQADPLSCANSLPGSVRASLGEGPLSQSPFRILLESKRTSIFSRSPINGFGSSVQHSSSKLMHSPANTRSPRTPARLLLFSGSQRSSSAPHTPSPTTRSEYEHEGARSPFRLLLASRRTLNLTDYSLGDSDPVSVSRSPFRNSIPLQEVDRLFEGPCLFPDDEEDDDD